jgi:hypothetical protein
MSQTKRKPQHWFWFGVAVLAMAIIALIVI